MYRFIFTITCFILTLQLKADNQQLLLQLDQAINKKEQFLKEKEDRIRYLKNKLSTEKRHVETLPIYNDLYKEYYVFQFDSAMIYADKGLQQAKLMNDKYYSTLFTIHRSEILAIGGLYTEAIDNIKTLQQEQIDEQFLFEYNYTFFTIYSYWSDYCNDHVYAPQYRDLADSYLEKAMEHADKENSLHNFYLGEYHVYVEENDQKARELYTNITQTVDERSRVYAMASYALAGNYRMQGDDECYEQYLIMAALSDLQSCTMETMALQNLAMFLFEKGKDQLERAERYINISMEDARFYNNRLRMLEISNIMPQIMTSYQTTIKKQNHDLRYSVIFISILVVGLLLTAYYIYRQNRKLHASRKELANNNEQLQMLNEQLEAGNQQQKNLNSQLQDLNQRLVDTNSLRENLASIYIDLCAKYIDKLGKYQTLVKRKIKANQAQELLQTISSTRISEEDAATFLNRFDKAFLELYPTFISEFNALLSDDSQIHLKSATTLNTELRTFALMRLGVKNTNDIAGLLFLSPQTIYNCRSTIKGKAINKDTFDDDVMNLCTIIKTT